MSFRSVLRDAAAPAAGAAVPLMLGGVGGRPLLVGVGVGAGVGVALTIGAKSFGGLKLQEPFESLAVGAVAASAAMLVSGGPGLAASAVIGATSAASMDAVVRTLF